MCIMERGRAMEPSLLQRPLYLSPCFMLSHVLRMGTSPSNLFLEQYAK